MSAALDRWLSRVSARSRPTYKSAFLRFCRSLQMGPDELVARQKNGSGDGRYELLDRLQEYVNALPGTLNYKLSTYTAVRSFFLHNRCELPRERHPDKKSKRLDQ